jgi:diguanylate cyclase (GGDEF)-like protein/PAS domain S-box-containing protein
VTPRASRAAAVLGIVTAVAGLLVLAGLAPYQEVPVPVASWLIASGLALTALSLLSARGAARTGVLLQARRLERDRAESARRAADERSRELAKSSGDVLATLGPDGRVRHVSAACLELLGAEPEALLGMRAVDLVHPSDYPGPDVFDGDDHAVVSARLRAAGGGWRWAEAKLHAVRDPAGDGVVEVHAIVRDVHERLEAERALADAEARFRTAFEEAPIGMAVASIDGRFLQVNRALCQITGRDSAELDGMPVERLVHPDDREEHAEGIARLARGDASSVRGERRWVHAAGQLAWVALNTTLVRDGAGTPQHVLMQVQDVTERRRYETELRYLADHDPLTGLLNRRAFAAELEAHLEHVQRYGPTGAALVLDLDHFKHVNDTLGHGAGDDVIVAIAHSLRDQLDPRCALARLGGDELAVLAPDGDVTELIDDVLDAVRAQRVATPSGRLRTISASLGIADFDGEGLTADDVLINADLAMYEAKDAGRDRAVRFVASRHEAARAGGRVAWTDVIKDGLDEDRFVLQAQPIVDLATGDFGQYELLLRLRDPLGELIPPAAFLPAAERYDLIGAIDAWVVTRAIGMVAEENRRNRRITVEVNISGRSTGDPELLELIEEQLREHRVDPAQIIFEITETTAVANIPRAQEFASRLAALGCRFALDDFGAAFASFYYLKHLPFDYLKIDGEFVRACVSDKTDQLVIRAVVDIARGLGKRTVAEMVGDEETISLLRELGVDHAQGFHVGRPGPLAHWLVERKVPARTS